MGVTGTEGTSAIRVMATVREIFETFVKQQKPDVIMFVADKSDGSGRGSRARLYDRFAKTFARKYGYELKKDDDGSQTEFEFYKKLDEETLNNMKSFVGYITEEALGDCYESAFHWILELDADVVKYAAVCHGMVHGQGALEGKKFGHAWGEMGGMVFDYSNGNKVTMPKAAYYAIGKIDESEVFRYPGYKALGKAGKAKHYGPWDMTGATVDVDPPKKTRKSYKLKIGKDGKRDWGVTPVAEGKRIKAIVDRVKEIGKRKVRIPKNILSRIVKKK